MKLNSVGRQRAAVGRWWRFGSVRRKLRSIKERQPASNEKCAEGRQAADIYTAIEKASSSFFSFFFFLFAAPERTIAVSVSLSLFSLCKSDW